MSLITLAAIGSRTRLAGAYHPGDGTMQCEPGTAGIWGAPSNGTPGYLLATRPEYEDTHAPVQAVYAVTGRSGDVLSVAIQEGVDEYFPAGTTLKLCTDTGVGGGSPTYNLPAFTSFAITGQSTIIEVGATVAGTSAVFTWTTSNPGNVQTNSIEIDDTTGSVTLESGQANDGSDTITFTDITKTTASTQLWTIFGTNTHGGLFSRTFAVNWLWEVYAGTSANVTLTGAQIKALADYAALSTGFARDYPLSAGGYKYLAYPDAMGDVVNILDANNLPFAMAQSTDNAAYSHVANGWSYALVAVTNAQSVTTNYRVYRSQFVLGGTATMKVT